MILARHNRLIPPYDDYKKLSLSELDKLAMREVSPSIKSFGVSDIDKEYLDIIKTTDLFVTSHSRRSKETCQMLCSLLDMNVKTVEDNQINEIYFKPSEMNKGLNESPLQTVRNSLFKLIKQDHYSVENKSSLNKRIQNIYKKYLGKSAILFSHGFFINLILAYDEALEQKYSFDHALEIASKKEPVNYLQMIKINQQ